MIPLIPLLSAHPLFALAGIVCVGLGTVGIAVPGLPTTPFLLAASYFFARSSPRLQRWLTQHRWFGPYLRAFRDERGMPVRGKVTTLAVLWISIGLSLAWLWRGTEEPWALTVFLLVCGLTVTGLVLFVFRTRPPSDSATESDVDRDG